MRDVEVGVVRGENDHGVAGLERIDLHEQRVGDGHPALGNFPDRECNVVTDV